jgi:DNA-binding transcriptional ArsR family regulator
MQISFSGNEDMSRTWQTKEKILESLRKKSKTLTDLSEELDLAPSTVSQHLHELLASGRIIESKLSMSKKWKYYEVNMAVVEAAEQEQRRWNMRDNRLLWAALAVAVVFGALFFAMSHMKAGVNGTTTIETFSQASQSIANTSAAHSSSNTSSSNVIAFP